MVVRPGIQPAKIRFPTMQNSIGLPIWNIEDLPKPTRNQFLENQLDKPWLNCQVCGIPAKLCCSGCKNLRCLDRQRYCSVECQQEDWLSHRNECKHSKEIEKSILENCSPEDASFLLRQVRQGRRWTHTLKESGALKWVVRQAFLTVNRPREITRPHAICLHINMVSADLGHPQSPIKVATYEWKPFVQYEGETTYVENPSMPYTHYELRVNGAMMDRGIVHVLPEAFCPATYQWTWVFKLCAIVGDISPVICKIRLELLTTTLHNYHHISGGILWHFYMGKMYQKVSRAQDGKFEEGMEDIQVMDESSLVLWMHYMLPVTGRLGSRFHPPCKTVIDHYVQESKALVEKATVEEMLKTINLRSNREPDENPRRIHVRLKGLKSGGQRDPP